MKKHFLIIAGSALFAFAIAAGQAEAKEHEISLTCFPQSPDYDPDQCIKDIEGETSKQKQTVPCRPDKRNCPPNRPGKPRLPFPITSTGPTVPPKPAQSPPLLRTPTPTAEVHYKLFYSHARSHARGTGAASADVPVASSGATAAKKNPCEPPTTAKKCRDWINGNPKPPIRPKK